MTEELKELLEQRKSLATLIQLAGGDPNRITGYIASIKSLDEVLKVALVPDKWQEKAELFEETIDALGEQIDKFCSEVTEAYHFSLENKEFDTLKVALIDYQKWVEEESKSNIAEINKLQGEIQSLNSALDNVSARGETS